MNRTRERRSASVGSPCVAPIELLECPNMAGAAPACFVTGPRGRDLAEQLAVSHVYDLSSSPWAVGDELDGLQHDGEGASPSVQHPAVG